MQNRRAVLALVLASALAAAGCTPGGSDSEDEGEAIELVWTMPAVFEGDAQAVADRWNEQNPDRTVRVELLPDSADEQREQLSLELNAGGTTFDILGLDVIWTGEFEDNGWLESLDDLRGEVEDILLPGALESAQWNGELWAMPYISGSAFLYYRSDLVDTPPTTWQELVEIGQRVSEEEGIAPFVAQGARYEGMVVNYLEYLWSAGGDLFSEDGSQVVFGTGDAARTALDFMTEGMENGLFAAGYNSMTEEEARNEFQFGNAVFMRNWPYAYPLMSDEAQSPVAGMFDIAPLPTFTGEGTISAVGGINNAVSAFSEHKDAARDFVLFSATDPETQLTVSSEFSQVPVLESTFEELEGDPVFDVLAEVVPYARARPPVPEYNEISVTIQREIFEAYNGQKDPEAAIDIIQSALEEVVSN